MELRKMRWAILPLVFVISGCFARYQPVQIPGYIIPVRTRPMVTEDMDDKEKKLTVMKYAIQLESDIKVHNEYVQEKRNEIFKKMELKPELLD